jgi:hypothetical protein
MKTALVLISAVSPVLADAPVVENVVLTMTV